MDAPRLIKKYANRRLYDTVESRHVTLAGLRAMIVAGTDVKVIDDTTGEDITRALLLQIIVDREQAGEPLLTEVLLAQLIRFHGNPMQGMMADYLQRSVGTFLEQQRSVQSRFRTALAASPAETLRELAETNAAAWGALMNGFVGPRADGASSPETTPSSGAEPASPEDDGLSDKPPKGAAAKKTAAKGARRTASPDGPDAS